MKSPALVKVRIGRGSDPTVKGGLKAVNARIDGLEWKMDGEFRQSTRKSGHRQGLLGFGASAMRFGAALCRAWVHCASAGISSDELSESRPFESVAC